MRIRIVVFVVIMAAFALPMHAASFDCAKAKSRAELLVCSDAELSSLDDELAKIYAKAKSLTPSPAEFKAQGEREWKKRETTCSDKQCLLLWYAQRRDQLLSVINAQTAKPSPPPSSTDAAVIPPKPNTAVAEKSAPPPNSKQDAYRIQGAGYHGCIDKENFRRLRDLLMRGDDAAYLNEMAASVKKGDCLLLHKGERVSLEEGTVKSTVIKIKKEGNPHSYWTTAKAILPQPEK